MSVPLFPSEPVAGTASRCIQELATAFSGMLRSRSQRWFDGALAFDSSVGCVVFLDCRTRSRQTRIAVTPAPATAPKPARRKGCRPAATFISPPRRRRRFVLVRIARRVVPRSLERKSDSGSFSGGFFDVFAESFVLCSLALFILSYQFVAMDPILSPPVEGNAQRREAQTEQSCCQMPAPC